MSEHNTPYRKETAVQEARRLRFAWQHIEKLSPVGRNYLRARLADLREEARMRLEEAARG